MKSKTLSNYKVSRTLRDFYLLRHDFYQLNRDMKSEMISFVNAHILSRIMVGVVLGWPLSFLLS